MIQIATCQQRQQSTVLVMTVLVSKYVRLQVLSRKPDEFRRWLATALSLNYRNRVLLLPECIAQ